MNFHKKHLFFENHMKLFLNCFMILMVSLILGACGRSKQPEFYILSPIPPQKTTLHKPVLLKLGIYSIRTPAFTEKPQLLVYDSVNRVQIEEFHQWSEPLDKNIKRVIKTNLNTLLPGLVMEETPWNIEFNPDYHIELEIAEIRMDCNGNSSLRASYLISKGPSIHKYQRYYYIKVPNVTMESLVASLNHNLNHLSKDIATTLRTLK